MNAATTLAMLGAGPGFLEIALVFAVVLVLFGPKRLPEIGSGLGKAIGSFKKEVGDVKESGQAIIDDLPGVKEVSEVKDQIDKVKNITSITK